MEQECLDKLGQNLKKYRLLAKLTQEHLAEIVNIHATYVGKLEAGKNNPSVKLLCRMANALNVSVKDLFDF
ncbi:MAG: helix-turn-helix domain-containing protein [Candidatus Gastranaerophilales bacterium]|nr:helix-turn-helix domain-containing protein [Candidatus Gastranaerophilales bacterium]